MIKAGSTAAIVDAAGNKWTITSGGQVAVNGVVDATTARVTVLAYEKGLVWQENADKLWWSKSKPTDAWGPAAGTTTSPIPPTVTPVPTPAPTPVPSGAIVVGSGSDSIVLMMSEDADGPIGAAGRDAQFTVNVDGKQVGGTLTTTAVSWQGQTQEFDLHGNWGTGAHQVTITYLNDASGQKDAAGNTYDAQDRNLYVNAMSYDGKAVSGTPWELFSNGSKTFTVPATTTTTSTSAAQAQPTITQTLASGQVSTVDASKAGTTQANGDTFSLTASGVGKAVLGAATETLRFAGMSNLSLTGGTGKATVIADRGTHTFTAGKGALDVTGGTGADTYVVNAGAGALTVQDFSRAQGDVLSIDRRLQAGAVIGSDGHGGTAISFHAAGPVTGTIDLKNVAALPTDSIRWV
ncbi:MAG: hypothetical protein J0H57_07145 [Rhodospirillales bacterium]|nr:hypothetical protein [Rhodospirillales bacterium]